MSVTLHLHDEFKRQFRRLKKKYQSLTDDLGHSGTDPLGPDLQA